MWDELPHTFCKDGAWYFAYANTQVPLAGSQGDKAFMGHYHTLCRLYRIGEPPLDQRSVYFVAWDGGPIKIGLASDVADRLRGLQNACPYELSVLALTSGGRETETGYHKQFAAHRLKGEWFERAPEIEAEIARLNEMAKAA